MNYHPDDFLALVEEVESQGGAHLSDVHVSQRWRSTQPLDWNNPTGPNKHVQIAGSGCHRRAQFLVPLLPEAYFTDEELAAPTYDFHDGSHPMAVMSDGETPALAKVCAVDDSMGLWPRFQDVMHTGSSFEVG